MAQVLRRKGASDDHKVKLQKQTRVVPDKFEVGNDRSQQRGLFRGESLKMGNVLCGHNFAIWQPIWTANGERLKFWIAGFLFFISRVQFRYLSQSPLDIIPSKVLIGLT